MSLLHRTAVVFTCDELGCRNETHEFYGYDPEGIALAAERARLYASRAGWFVSTDESVSFCREHREGRALTPPEET